MILDSNIIIYSNQRAYQALLSYLDSQKQDLQVSLITQLEVLGFHKLDHRDKADFEAFFASVSELPLDEDIITEAIRLRQQRKRSLADSIIAATGLIYNQPVLTNNGADFTDVAGLTVIDMDDVVRL